MWGGGTSSSCIGGGLNVLDTVCGDGQGEGRESEVGSSHDPPIKCSKVTGHMLGKKDLEKEEETLASTEVGQLLNGRSCHSSGFLSGGQCKLCQ